MKDYRADYALARLAKEKGITLQELTDEIQTAINVTYANRDESVEQHSKIRKEYIPCVGEVPTPAEMIAYIVRQVQLRMNDEVL